jgi:hypothetical protein
VFLYFSSDTDKSSSWLQAEKEDLHLQPDASQLPGAKWFVPGGDDAGSAMKISSSMQIR